MLHSILVDGSIDAIKTVNCAKCAFITYTNGGWKLRVKGLGSGEV